MDEPLTVTTPDGAIIAYEILGAQWIGRRLPIVLVCGMTALRGDWERLASRLAQMRPVLIFDHRGMGDSTFASPTKGDEITIESLARDLVWLLATLHWKELAICGFSMGGVVTQQLLFLPYHPQNPQSLPFRVTHVFLAATLCATIWDPDKRYRLKIDTSAPPRPLTDEEKKAKVRPVLDSTFDSAWLENPKNKERYEWWLSRMLIGRPTHTLSKQGRALKSFDFAGYHEKLPRDIKFLVIHGKNDTIVPYSCGEELLKRIPWACAVEIGTRPGQIPNLAFGHHWFEYFPVQIWVNVIESFLRDSSATPRL
ncbi:3-oxoadipate enol-lactonase [Moniliophthora roreri MCA 2997]|uniref:3-oxoadipate enol-lactonase n=1 Tax=Moniliophthora roreri (strain MCA 2997) TaxID=1381753 RepID=V2XCD5_MONRO|nr:3-oxoadipate enol-lactonase [Moniliophthora roreri MCA 2997]